MDTPASAARDTYLSLSKSLQELLSDGAGNPSAGAGDEDRNNSESHAHHHPHQPDVYHQYLNSPPLYNANTINTNVNRNAQQQRQKQWWKGKLERWLHDAMQIVGVGTNANIVQFWRRDYGGDDDDDDSMSSLVNCRYMVYFVQNVLLHQLMINENNDEKNMDDPMLIVEIYHKCGLQLLNNNSFADVAIDTNEINNNNEINNTQQDEENDSTNTAGVIWQMLLQNVNLTPEKLRKYYHTYCVQRFGGTGIPPNNLIVLPFAWPSFFQYATAHAAAAAINDDNCNIHPNKRRRRSNESNVDWWSLFGYFLGHVILSSSSSSSTMLMNDNDNNKVQYLKEYICTKLPTMLMNIGSNNNYNNSHMKNSLLCGIVASVIDELGEWTIMDGLILDDIDIDNNNTIDVDNISSRSRPSVVDIVELLLMDAGILSKLATLTRTRLANLVGEVADAILNYSIGSHRLRLHFKDQDDNDDYDIDNSAVLYQQHVARDADYVVHFIDKANPQLKEQLLGGNFIPGQYNLNPPHPMVIYTRAHLSSNRNLSIVARLLRKLEDSKGIEYATKCHCYALLLESMQDRGVLFEDGWNGSNEQGGEATLANVTLGILGYTCALEYMRNVILVAKENLLPLISSHSSSQVRQQSKRELSCVKDAVHRTVLKLCLHRPYSYKEALDLANTLSDAEGFPKLDNLMSDSVNGSTTEAVVIRILKANSLYSVYDGDINVEEEDDSIYEEEDDVLANETSFELVQESARLLVHEPIPTDNHEHEADEQIDTERDNSSHFDDNKNEVIDLEDSHSSVGIYSESDDYDNEEEEEEEKEGRNAYNEHQEDAIEILSSVDEEEEDNDDDEDEEDASSEEERNEALDTLGTNPPHGSIESAMQFKQYDQSVYKDDESSGEYSSYDNTSLEVKMADDEQADDEQSIDTEEDKRMFVETFIDTEDEKPDGCQESLGERVDGVKYDVASLLEDQPIKEFDEMKKGLGLGGSPSVLVAAAISSQRLENNPLYLEDVHSDSDEVDDENDISTKVAEDGRNTDDGYAPDADATEEEDTVRIKKDSIRILDGYDPDAELTEEEQQEKPPPKEEVELILLRSNELTHIDEGYLPDGTLKEEERVETFLNRNEASFKDASSPTAGNDLMVLEDFFLPHDDNDDDHVASLSMSQQDQDDPEIQVAVVASLGMQDMMEGEDPVDYYASLSMLQQEQYDPEIQMRGPGRPKEEEDITALDIQAPIKKKPRQPKKSKVVAASSQNIMEEEDPADNHDESSEFGFPVSSRRKKQDASSTSTSTTRKSATTSASVRKSGRRKSPSKKILNAASQDVASDSISAQQKAVTSVSFTRRSGGRKTQELQPDTPISKLSSVLSESDEDTVQSTETPNSSGHSVPATIETRRNRVNKPALAAVPEERIVEDSTVSADAILTSETLYTKNDVKRMKVAELKEALQERGLSTDGLKSDLQSRLVKAVISDDRDIPVEKEISSITTSKRKSVRNPPKSKKKAKLLGDDEESVSEKLSISSRTRRIQPIVDDRSHSSDISKSGRYSIRSSSTKRTKARNVEEEDVQKKRGLGRPKKEEGITADTTTPLDVEDVVVAKKKGPGRPKRADKEKIELADETKRERDESVTSRAISTRSGHKPEPPKSQNKKESMDEHDSAGPMSPSKKRGRPPKKPSLTETVIGGRSGLVGASGRGKAVDDGESMASSRRSTRSVASKATDSTSMATRHSNRRAK